MRKSSSLLLLFHEDSERKCLFVMNINHGIHESNVTLCLVSMRWNFETNLTPFAAFACVHTSRRTTPHVRVFFFCRFAPFSGQLSLVVWWWLFTFSNTLGSPLFFSRASRKNTHGYFHRYRAWRVHGHLHDWCDPERRGTSSSSRLLFLNVVVSMTTTRFYLCPIFVRTSPPRVVRFHFWEILAFSRILCDECSSLSILKLALIITHDQYYQ